MAGLFLAAIGVLVLVAWRSGYLGAVLSRATGADTSENANATDTLHPADYLPTAGMAPRTLSPIKGGIGTGVVDNGVTPRGGDAAVASAYTRFSDLGGGRILKDYYEGDRWIGSEIDAAIAQPVAGLTRTAAGAISIFGDVGTDIAGQLAGGAGTGHY